MRCWRQSDRYWVVAGLVVVVLVGWAWRASAANTARARAAFARAQQVKPGMTRDEVEAVLGGPPGDHRSDHDIVSPEHSSNGNADDWSGDDGTIRVLWSGDHAKHTEYFWPRRQGSGLCGRVRAWLFNP